MKLFLRTFFPDRLSNSFATKSSSKFPKYAASLELSDVDWPVFSSHNSNGVLYLFTPRMTPASLPPIPLVRFYNHSSRDMSKTFFAIESSFTLPLFFGIIRTGNFLFICDLF